MLHAASKHEKFGIWTGFLPALFLNCILNMAAMAWAPEARAQAAGFTPSNGQISGSVVLETGRQPMSQVIVSLRSESAGISRSVLTDYEGKFEVQGLAPGIYEIGVDETGFEPARIRAELKGALQKLELRLRPAKRSQNRQNNFTVSVTQLKIPDKAREEYRKGLESLNKNDTAGSLSHLKKAIAMYPGYSEAYYHMGVVDAKIGHGTDAMEAFHKALDLAGGNYAWAEFGVGFLLCQQGKPEEAEAIVRKGLETDKDSAEGHVVLGMALLRLNRLDEAEQNAHEALQHKPDSAGAYLVLADVYALRGEYRAQADELNMYLKLQPNGEDSASVRHAREVALRNVGKIPEAEK